MKKFLFITLLLMVALTGVFSQESKAVTVKIWLDSPVSTLLKIVGPASPLSGVQQAPQKMTTIMLPPTLPESMKTKNRQDISPFDLPSSLGATFSYEYVSIGDDDSGNVFGFSGQYERKWGKIVSGGLLSYKYHDIEVTGLDFSSNLLGGLVYGSYLLIDEPLSLCVGVNAQVDYMFMKEDFIDDYASYGGGLFFTVGKKFGLIEVAGGFSYNYGAMDIDISQDAAHLIKYGIIIGMPVAEAFAANFFVTDTRNVASYDIELEDTSYVSLGVEGTWHMAGSWVLTASYKTILGIDEFSSHELYLGTIRKF